MEIEKQKLIEQIKLEKCEIEKLKKMYTEGNSKIKFYEKELFQYRTDVFEKCVEIIKERSSLLRGWRSRESGNRTTIVFQLYCRSKEEKINMFMLLDCLYTFVKKERDDVPSFEDSMEIFEYLRRDEYKIKDEAEIAKLPLDVQILLITKKAYEIRGRYGSFKRFKDSIVDTQCRYGPN